MDVMYPGFVCHIRKPPNNPVRAHSSPTKHENWIGVVYFRIRNKKRGRDK
jgi:hypothetical protein